MTETFHESTSRRIGTRWICPHCVEHKQEKAGKNGYENDCKNTFHDDSGKIVSQCCCWSDSHDFYEVTK